MPAAPTLGGTRKPAGYPYQFRPRPGDFGAQFQTLSNGIGNAGVTLTGTATTSVYLSVPASRLFKVVAASIQGFTGAAGGSTITAQLVRNNNQGTPTAQTLTAAQDITTTVFTGTDNNVDVPITVTDQLATCAPGDTLLWKIVAATTITTVPSLRVSAEVSVIY